jgi:NADPH-dependent 2,4-dienoyl-CoA reductase/sulfur reductase-like enzyme
VSTLRQEGFGERIILIGAEPQPPYEQPPLSKEYLRGEFPFEGVLIQPPGFYDQNSIETRFEVRVTRVDTAEKMVEIDGGERVAYDRLLVATGGQNRRLPIPGLDLDGSDSLRTVADSDRIRVEIASGRKAVVVGMGFIGSEVAASLRQSNATSSWWASAPSRSRISSPVPEWRSTTASSSTSTSGWVWRASTQRATWPTTTTRCSGGGYAWSTRRTR